MEGLLVESLSLTGSYYYLIKSRSYNSYFSFISFLFPVACRKSDYVIFF